MWLVTLGQVFGIVCSSASFDWMLKMFNLPSVICSCAIWGWFGSWIARRWVLMIWEVRASLVDLNDWIIASRVDIDHVGFGWSHGVVHGLDLERRLMERKHTYIWNGCANLQNSCNVHGLILFGWSLIVNKQDEGLLINFYEWKISMGFTVEYLTAIKRS